MECAHASSARLASPPHSLPLSPSSSPSNPDFVSRNIAVGVQTPEREAVASCDRGGGRVEGAVAYIYARNCRIHLHIHKFSLSAPKATVAAPKNATFSLVRDAQAREANRIAGGV